MLNIKPTSKRHNQRGFTIVELLVIAPVIILMIGSFITVIVNMTGEVLTSRASNVLVYNIQDSLSRIEQDVKLSTTFLAQSMEVASPQGYDNDTTRFENVDNPSDGDKGDMLILNTLATNGNPLTDTSSIFYLNNQPNPCSSTNLIQNTPMTMNIVYFIKDDPVSGASSLWRRTIAPADYNTAGCPAPPALPWQQPSCLPEQTGLMCATQDVKLLEEIEIDEFSVDYFATADSTVADDISTDHTESIDTRNAALSAVSTVGVSLTVNKTTAGRDISQTGTVRATRLDINASSIALPVIASTPVSPTVSVTHTSPASAVFTWPGVEGATGYTFQYQIAGGGWQTAFTNQNNLSYTVTAGHNQLVEGRASATNSNLPALEATSAYSTTASLRIPLWATPVFENTWSDYLGSYNTGAYTKTSDGMVVFKGLIKRNGTVVSGETIFTLPDGYRPPFGYSYGVASNSISGRVNVYPDGRVIASTDANAAWLSLETISFYPSTAPYTWTNFGFSGGWSNRNLVADSDPPFGYMLDGAGRVNVRGALSPGTQTDGTVINSPALPASHRPPQYMHVAVRSGGNGYNTIGLDASGNILAKGGSAGTALFTVATFLPSSYSGTWTNLTFSGTWTNYGGIFSTAQYTKTSDGMVVLKGLVRAGAPGSVIGVLPSEFRPKDTVLADSSCAGVWCRIDIRGNGEIYAGTGSSGTWTSLDGLTFFAEQ